MTVVVIPVVETVKVVVDGVAINVTVGVIVRVSDSTVDIVDKNGAIVETNTVVVVVSINDVIVETVCPGRVDVVNVVEAKRVVVEVIEVVVVDEKTKLVMTMIVVEKLNDVLADLVCVDELVVVVRKKLVVIENPVKIVDVLVKDRVMTFRSVIKFVLVTCTITVSVSVSCNTDVDVRIELVVSVIRIVVSRVRVDGKVTIIFVVVVKVTKVVTVVCAIGKQNGGSHTAAHPSLPVSKKNISVIA